MLVLHGPAIMSAHPSSWTSRQLRDHAAETGRGAWETADAELQRVIGAAVAAVQAEIAPHLAADDILHPEHEWFDAALARQAVCVVLVDGIGIPRRQVAAVSLMSREAVLRGYRTIAKRCERPAFAAAMERAMRRAQIESRST